MKKTFVISLVIITLAIAFIFSNISITKGKYQGNITINADGTITPEAAPIIKEGNILTLTSDLDGSISIIRSNIVLKGDGHTVHGILSLGYVLYVNTFPSSGVFNITVENFVVSGDSFGIQLTNSSNAVITNNTITNTGNGFLSMDEQTAAIYVDHGGSNNITGNSLFNNYNGMLFIETQYNLVIENKINYCSNPYGFTACGVLFWGASNNTVYHNNFVNNSVQAYDGITIYAAGDLPLAKNNWANGFSSGGNYWSDYQTKYPNASQVDNSGIGDTSYFIDAQNEDRYPLMEPFNVTAVVEVSPTPNGSTPPVQANNIEPDLKVLIVLAVMIAIILVIAGLVVYYNRRRH